MSEFTKSSAQFSPCKLYRYTLERWWSGIYGANDYACFIMLNPSVADERQDDPTVHRAAMFAKRWGFAGLIVTNIFAYRATDPQKLYGLQVDLVGPDNDDAILRVAKGAKLVVCAWGCHGALRGRAAEVIDTLKANAVPMHCLGVTKAGFPKHPLYMRADKPIERFA